MLAFFVTVEEFVLGIAVMSNEDYFSIQVLCFVFAYFYKNKKLEE